MSIDFSSCRWEHTIDNYRRWWSKELKRPIIQVATPNHDPGRPEPELVKEYYASAYGLTVSAEAIVDRWDYNLSRLTYFGDAFPNHMPFFGAGVLAAFLGARLEQRAETCWFHPPAETEPADIAFRFDPENQWFKRICELYTNAAERWEGSVQLNMTDLGGGLDILSSFRPGDKLLFDLFDHPGEVKRLNWEIHELWWKYFDKFNSIIGSTNPGYTAWTPLLSEEPYYMLQCDFCYMISPEMFDEFVKPELTASCKRLKNAFYHLDGPGQLPHLDSLLEIEELKGVQWIPGTGSPGIGHWPEVFRKIRDAGKLIQFYGDFHDLDTIVGQLGSPEGLATIMVDPDGQPITSGVGEMSETEITDALHKYGVVGKRCFFT
ncbi:MAG: hypothetical protein U9P14_08240 [Gemmatimonadota bacterium]|nr:hypothetical protein [Gemmatimonadota bacterium]